MKCGYPHKLSDETSVPCGRCMPCRITKRQMWAGRILLEAKYARNASSFVTLTYNNDNLPPGGNLVRRDLNQFVDRLRKRSGIGECRYFGVGEYGTETQRPHYHLAIFDTPPDAWESRIRDCWKKGFTHVGQVEKRSANYITGYCLKKMTTHDDDRLDGRQPEFAVMSKRPPLGAAGINRIRDLLSTKHGSAGVAAMQDAPASFRLNGVTYPIGEYWRNYLRDFLGITDPPRQADWIIDYETAEKEQRQATRRAEKLWRDKDRHTKTL